MVLGNTPGPDVIVVLGGIITRSDPRGPSGSMAPKHQHFPRWQLRSWIPAQPTTETGVTDISLTLTAVGTADTAPGFHSGQDNTMALEGGTGHLVL